MGVLVNRARTVGEEKRERGDERNREVNWVWSNLQRGGRRTREREWGERGEGHVGCRGRAGGGEILE